MMTLFVLLPLVALFMVINAVIGCYILIRLGYGPPNWQTALNLVIRLTTFQNYLNNVRDWFDRKAPWTEKLFNRLRIPKPIVIIDTTVDEFPDEPEDEAEDESTDEQTEESAEETEEGAPVVPEPASPPTVQAPASPPTVPEPASPPTVPEPVPPKASGLESKTAAQ